MAQVLAYLITFHTYGTWLRGDDRGSHDRGRRAGPMPPNAPLREWQRHAMVQPPMQLDTPARQVVVAAIRETCRVRDWTLAAVHARVEHVHVVTSLDATTPERAMGTLKAWSTRRLREACLVADDRRVWSRHGSTVRLWNAAEVARAIEYTVAEQGVRVDWWQAGME